MKNCGLVWNSLLEHNFSSIYNLKRKLLHYSCIVRLSMELFYKQLLVGGDSSSKLYPIPHSNLENPTPNSELLMEELFLLLSPVCWWVYVSFCKSNYCVLIILTCFCHCTLAYFYSFYSLLSSSSLSVSSSSPYSNVYTFKLCSPICLQMYYFILHIAFIQYRLRS